MDTTPNKPLSIATILVRRREFREIPPQADGCLCMGGDLSPERLIAAYSLGIFPWYSADTPILWWSPDPRCILPLDNFHLKKRSARAIRNTGFCLSWDRAFTDVVAGCAAPRKDGCGTWLIDEMQTAYTRLHKLGYAHSVETWLNGTLVGGLYGIGLGGAFFGESMFHTVREASRAALVGLVQILRIRACVLLDCQQETPHMRGMGARLLSRPEFQDRLAAAGLNRSAQWSPWNTTYAWEPESSSWSEKSK